MNKQKSQFAVRDAVRLGNLKKPSYCDECRKFFKKSKLAGHHHRGYKPEFMLDVKWLCQRCHAKAHDQRANGEVNGNSKLTEEKVRYIRQKYIGKYGQLSEISKELGVYVTTIRDIVLKRTWRQTI